MKQLIEIQVNGVGYEFAVEPQTTLAEALREQLGLTGTKDSCGTGECGPARFCLRAGPPCPV